MAPEMPSQDDVKAYLEKNNNVMKELLEEGANAAIAAKAEDLPGFLSKHFAGAAKQSAFVFIKPHAKTDAVEALVKKKFEEVGIEITAQGEYTGTEIDEKKYIDNHYYAIVSKATLLKPTELNVPKDKFKEKFGEEWDDVLKEDKKVLNAKDAAEHLGISGEDLDALWMTAKKADKLVKFGGGFYCAYIEEKKLYTFNAFFMVMRGKFTAKEAAIKYFVVEFAPNKLSWSDFRDKVLGPTDPSAAPADSIRGMVNADWEKLGLKAACSTGDNAVHASASPFEGFAEKHNWLGMKIADDKHFGAKLLEAGLSEKMITEWAVDPQVTIAPDKKGSIFDQLECLDAPDCLAKCVKIALMQ